MGALKQVPQPSPRHRQDETVQDIRDEANRLRSALESSALPELFVRPLMAIASSIAELAEIDLELSDRFDRELIAAQRIHGESSSVAGAVLADIRKNNAIRNRTHPLVSVVRTKVGLIESRLAEVSISQEDRSRIESILDRLLVCYRLQVGALHAESLTPFWKHFPLRFRGPRGCRAKLPPWSSGG